MPLGRAGAPPGAGNRKPARRPRRTWDCPSPRRGTRHGGGIDVGVPVDGAVRLQLVLHLGARGFFGHFVDRAALGVQDGLVEGVLDRLAQTRTGHLEIGLEDGLLGARVVVEKKIGGFLLGFEIGQEGHAERGRRVIADDHLAGLFVLVHLRGDGGIVPAADVIDLEGDFGVGDVISFFSARTSRSSSGDWR